MWFYDQTKPQMAYMIRAQFFEQSLNRNEKMHEF